MALQGLRTHSRLMQIAYRRETVSLDISKSSAMALVVTSHNFHGLSVEIVKKIAWAAMEPTPTARIISNLRMTYEGGLSEWVALVVTHPSNCGPDWSDLRQYWPR